MELDTSSLMMFFFLLLLVISIWKIYAFLPRERLSDDDTTKESQQELLELIIKIVVAHKGKLSTKELFDKIKADKEFDKKHYWRFNQNRLNQLLALYYLQNPDTKSIEDIYKKNS